MLVQVNGEVRPATAEEQAISDQIQTERDAFEAAVAAREAARASALAKLAALGLTEDEAAALVGA